MGIYKDRLDVTPRKNGKTWITLEKFRYETDNGDVIIVQKWFKTDFASVPRALWALISRWGKHGFAAVIHDWLYWDQPEQHDRKAADKIFLEAMATSGVNLVKRQTMYRAVRAIGGFAWCKNTRDKANGEQRVGNSPPGIS